VVSGALGLAAGAPAQRTTVAALGDAVAEPTETFAVNLSAAFNATIADAQGVGTILDDDAAVTPTVAIDDVTVTEGNAGTTTAVFTVSLSAKSGQNGNVDDATANDTATAQGDHPLTSRPLTFAPGVTTHSITVAAVGETIFEANEHFLVNLSNPVNATLADAQGIGTITNDDAPPTLAVNDVTVTEGDTGTTSAVFTVT